jgi:hypothetical protein
MKKWPEIVTAEQLLKDALSFYEGSPDGQYDEIAVLCIRYAMMMKPWEAPELAGLWTRKS